MRTSSLTGREGPSLLLLRRHFFFINSTPHPMCISIERINQGMKLKLVRRLMGNEWKTNVEVLIFFGGYSFLVTCLDDAFFFFFFVLKSWIGKWIGLGWRWRSFFGKWIWMVFDEFVLWIGIFFLVFWVIISCVNVNNIDWEQEYLMDLDVCTFEFGSIKNLISDSFK